MLVLTEKKSKKSTKREWYIIILSIQHLEVPIIISLIIKIINC